MRQPDGSPDYADDSSALSIETNMKHAMCIETWLTLAVAMIAALS